MHRYLRMTEFSVSGALAQCKFRRVPVTRRLPAYGDPSIGHSKSSSFDRPRLLPTALWIGGLPFSLFWVVQYYTIMQSMKEIITYTKRK